MEVDEYRAVSVLPGGEVEYRAGALGSCTRALVACRQDYEVVKHKGKLINKFAAGRVAEEIAMHNLTAMGYVVSERAVPVRLRITERLSVVGHVDGVGISRAGGRPFVIEAKSHEGEGVGREEYRKWPLWPRYSWQISSYMLATGYTCLLCDVNRTTGDMWTYEILTPPVSKQEIRGRVLQVESMATQELAALECDRRDFPCPVFYTHKEVERELVDDETMEELGRAYNAAQVRQKHAKEQYKATRDALIGYVGRPDEGEVREKKSGGVAVRIKSFPVQAHTVSFKARIDTRVTVDIAERQDGEGGIEGAGAVRREESREEAERAVGDGRVSGSPSAQ